MDHAGNGKKLSKKRERSEPYEEDAEEFVETVVEGIVFRASVRPHNWGARKQPDAAATGGARGRAKGKGLTVKLRMTDTSHDRPMITKKAARNYPAWACTKCTYGHVNNEASLRKCAMCGTPRKLQGADVETVVEPPSGHASTASAVRGHSFLCEGAAAVERPCGRTPAL